MPDSSRLSVETSICARDATRFQGQAALGAQLAEPLTDMRIEIVCQFSNLTWQIRAHMRNRSRMIYDCIVIGGGAAGLSAALVLGRARKRTLVVDAGEPSNRFAHGIGGLLGHDGRPPAEFYALGRSSSRRTRPSNCATADRDRRERHR